MTPVPIFVVHIENFSFFITASFTCATPLFNKAQFEYPLVLHFILTGATNLIQISDSAFVRAHPAAGFFICACKNRSSTYPTRSFFPIGSPVTF